MRSLSVTVDEMVKIDVDVTFACALKLIVTQRFITFGLYSSRNPLLSYLFSFFLSFKNKCFGLFGQFCELKEF